MFVTLDMHPLSQPEVMIGNANKAFDGNGRLIDEDSQDLIRQLLGHLCRWTRQVKGKWGASSNQ
ncbi:MAG: hypothetical protein D4S02_13320 [Rhodocyclaceae bacterium]|nr:MAG: hypothetical protein D4S02_13320 [Rhodocyclaceae bacterium]